jgi:hypothetical protein
MKLKRRRGATLGLVAVCVLVIIVLGIGFFILSQILGGGREIANATDAGVLTIARNALSPANINVALAGDSDANPVNDFIPFDTNYGGLSQSSGKIDMLGINRVVAQSVMVALNAQEINTGAATGHAQSVASAAQNVARNIRTLLDNNAYLRGQFTNVASANNTKMFQGNKATLTGPIVSGYMRPNFSTNVYWTQATQNAIGVGLPSNLKNTQSGALQHNTDAYMAGYVGFAIPVGGGTVNIAGVPVFPQQKPHLVDIGEFDPSAAADPLGTDYLPPNAFRTNTKTQENNSGNLGGAVACAIVGALDKDFPAQMPRGYVRIINGQPQNSGNVNNPVVDGTNDVFNNELWPPNGGGVDVANNGVFALNNNTGGQQLMSDWATFNGTPPTVTTTTTPAPAPPAPPAGPQATTTSSTTVTNPDGSTTTTTTTGPAQPPLPSANPGLYAGVKVVTPSGYRDVTDADVQGLTTIAKDCDAVDGWDRRPACMFPNDDGSSPGGGDVVHAIQAMTGANNTTAGVPASGYTAVENQKAQLLTNRGGGAKCATVVPVPPSGMKVFNPNGCYATPASPIDFGVVGSPLEYLNQISQGNPGCSNNVLQLITKRMQEADPSIDINQVRTALSTQQLRMGETLFLYSPGPGAGVQLDSAPPGAYFNPNLANDGNNSAVEVQCENQYNISNTIVNANKGAGPGTCGSFGDAHFHQAPFTQGPGLLRAADRAIFTPASGWRNLLGDVNFENEAKDSGTFCKPN